MPVTRRSTRASASAGPQQSTLSFKNKVTKSVPTSAKDKVHRAPALARVKEILPSPEPEEHQQPEIEVKQEKTEAEVRAANVTDAAISNYWKQIEDSRMAKEVHKKHTAGLSTGEKVLRYFDVSSQYGPSIGTTRLKRWQRAERLGLRPPIEALAVLLKEEAKGNEGIERAHMDELLSSTALGSA